MNLSRVWLDFPFPVTGGTRTELTSAEFGAMRYDAALQSLVFADGRGINWRRVVRWEAEKMADPEPPILGLFPHSQCSSCGKAFESPQALGGHRRYCQEKK